MNITRFATVKSLVAQFSVGVVLAGMVASAAAIQSRYNLPPPVTEIARDIHWLHWLVMGISGFIFVVVFGVMFYSIYAHRKSKGAQAANFHESTKVEILWTVIPFFLVILMAAPATKTVVAMKDTSNADLTIKATGYQWKWGYDYLNGEGEGISFLSELTTPRDQIDGTAVQARKANKTYLLEVDNELVVPVNKKVRIITTAQDVIHSWTIPAFGVKQDAIPGFVRDTWFKAEKTGRYYGQCVELCGKNHAFMPIVVNVVTAEDYTQWVRLQKGETGATAQVAQPDEAAQTEAQDTNKQWTLDELKARGQQVYAANCQVCHQANGKGLSSMFPALDGSAVVADTKAQIQRILNGKGAMPAWRSLPDAELAAVATYIKNAWGNQSGEAIQPAQFKAARQ